MFANDKLGLFPTNEGFRNSTYLITFTLICVRYRHLILNTTWISCLIKKYSQRLRDACPDCNSRQCTNAKIKSNVKLTLQSSICIGWPWIWICQQSYRIKKPGKNILCSLQTGLSFIWINYVKCRKLFSSLGLWITGVGFFSPY